MINIMIELFWRMKMVLKHIPKIFMMKGVLKERRVLFIIMTLILALNAKILIFYHIVIFMKKKFVKIYMKKKKKMNLG